jgi:multicomponent K+:H+ antiporter subunit F
MIEYALIYGYAALSVSVLLCLWRLLRGPSLMDRVLAVDTTVINVTALIILFGIQQRTTMLFETALLFAMFGFISTVAYCRFVLRGDVIE